MKTKHALLAVAFAIAGTGAVPAAAQVQIPEGLYVGASAGRGTARDFCSDAALGGGAARCDDKDTTWRLLAGWRFDRNFAVEVAYHDLGKYQATVAGVERDMRLRAVELDGLGILPVGGIASVYAKLGVFRAEAKGGSAFAGLSENRVRYTFGAGVQFDLSRAFAVRGEWQRYPGFGGGAFGGTTDVGVVSLGGLYRF